ncbi:MAG: ATP-binding protein [Polyangiaceae bacterium]
MGSDIYPREWQLSGDSRQPEAEPTNAAEDEGYPNNGRPPHSRAVVTVLVGVVYFGLARLSLLLAFQGTNASPVWPPSGFALTMVIAFGRITWPGIALGALVANAVTFVTNGAELDMNVLLASAVIALGNTSEAIVANLILQGRGNKQRSQLTNSLTLIFGSGVASAVAAAIGAGSIVFFGFAPRPLFSPIFLTWSIGDWVGMLLVAPLLLSLLPLKNDVLRVGRVSPTLVACAAACAIWLVTRGAGATGSTELNRSLLHVQAAIGGACILGLLLGSLSTRPTSERALQRVARARKFLLATAAGSAPDEMRSPAAPVLAGIGVLAISLLLWRSVLQDQNVALAAATEAATDNVIGNLESSLQANSRALLRLATRWNRGNGIPEVEWRDSARAFMVDFPGFVAFEYVDANGVLQLHESLQPGERNFGVEEFGAEERQLLLEHSRAPGTLTTVDVASSATHGPLLIFAVGLESRHIPDGAMLAVVQIATLFEQATGRVRPEFGVGLSDSTGLTLGSLESSRLARSSVQSLLVPGRSERIRVEVRASPEKARTLRSALPEVILGGGSALSAMVTALLFLAQEVLKRERSARRDGERLRGMNQELADARQRAEASGRAKSEFLANMSHELRTPMSAVVGLSALLRDSDLSARQREYVDDLELSSNLLRQLIDDILDLSKLDAGKVTLERGSFMLRPHLEKLVQLVARSAADKGLALEVDVDASLPEWFLGDALRLGQILLNLLSNAIKFTEKGGVYVHASAKVSESNGSAELRYEIRDTGSGISEAILSRLFAPFSQADASTTRRFGGTGLGLYISRSLVQLMDGELSCRSELGRGTTFTFSVKGALGSAEMSSSMSRIPAALPIAQQARRGRILVAEDNAFNRRIAVRLLENLGHEVEVAVDGMAAVSAVQSNRFDLVLMDWQMPGMDGLQATAAIRKQHGGHPPIVALTANAMEGDRARCLEAGMNDYLTKPLSSEALRAMLTRWLPAT